MRKHIVITIFTLFICNQAIAKSPSEALQALIEGNERYVKEQLLHPNRSTERREELSNKQKPFATILGCSDSRVTPEIIFDQGLGDLFVVRVAGNVAQTTELESIQYSIDHLNSSLILVLGHESCGAITAVMQGTTEDIQEIAALIKPAIQGSKTIEQAIKANVLSVVSLLRENTSIKMLLRDKKIDCVGAYFHLSTGKIEIL